MWTAKLVTDSRKTCFITVPQKWGLNFSQLPVVRIQQSINGQQVFVPVYASCSGDNGPQGNEVVCIGAQFARANNLKASTETVFQVIQTGYKILSTVTAEPYSADDWELLEMNVEQIQAELMNRVRIVWVGAHIPIWLSDFVSLDIKIVDIEPKCPFGLLANDTEIHISPPKVAERSGSVMKQERTTIASVLAQLLERYLPKIVPEKASPHIAAHLRVLPIEDPKLFLSVTAETHKGLVMQPYMAFVSKVHEPLENLDNIGCIYIENECSYFNIIYAEDRHDGPIFQDAVYLTDTLIRQLKLNWNQRVEVVSQSDATPAQCDGITFYTFVQDYDLKDLETKMWMQSITKDQLNNLVLNNGQHVDIPALIKGRKNRIFVSLHSKNKNHPTFCRLDESTLSTIIDKVKVVRVKPADAPKFLKFPGDDPAEEEKMGKSEQLGGVTSVIQQAEDFLKAGLSLRRTGSSNSFSGCRQGNMLLTGSRGSGRTSIARYLCNTLERTPFYVHTVLVDCSSLKGKKVETLHRDWLMIFHELIDRQPSVLVFDDLDLLASCPSTEGVDSLVGESWYYTRVAEVIHELVSGTSLLNQVMIVATALNVKSLHPILNHLESNHFFTCELQIPPLTKEMRMEVLTTVLKNKAINTELDIDYESITSKMDGYVSLDIVQVVDRATHLAVSQSGSVRDTSLGAEHLENAVENHIPFGLYGINLKPPADSRIAWSDVGGLAHAKKMLMETLKWPTQYPHLFARCPIRLRSALLLYGAPGTGKTMLAKAVATECGVNFISIKGPELLSKYIGASEESVRETFRRARSAKPCILFFDEFDSLAPRRGHDSTGVTDRVVNQLLTELDGVEGQEAGLWILAATSRPDLIDPALLRPGRFDVSVPCSLPTKDERLEILASLSSKLDLDDDVQLEEVALRADHFTGADLQALLYTAQLKAIHQTDLTAGDGEASPTIRITHQLLMSSLRETRPSVSASERQRYERIYENFVDVAGRNGSTPLEEHQRVTLA